MSVKKVEAMRVTERGYDNHHTQPTKNIGSDEKNTHQKKEYKKRRRPVKDRDVPLRVLSSPGTLRGTSTPEYR